MKGVMLHPAGVSGYWLALKLTRVKTGRYSDLELGSGLDSRPGMGPSNKVGSTRWANQFMRSPDVRQWLYQWRRLQRQPAPAPHSRRLPREPCAGDDSWNTTRAHVQ